MGQYDNGSCVSRGDKFEEGTLLWSMSRLCENHLCPNFCKGLSPSELIVRVA